MYKTVQGAVGKKCLPFFYLSCSFCRGRTTTLLISEHSWSVQSVLLSYKCNWRCSKPCTCSRLSF